MRNEVVIEKRRIADLVSHPSQQEYFGVVKEHEDAELAASMAERGLDHLPEILADGTIIKGHRRVRVARDILAWAELDVRVRYDLEDDAIRAEQEFLEDNLHPRQRDKLTIARGYRRLIELDKRRRHDPLDGKPKVDLREQACKRLDCSDRNLRRYFRVLDAPKAVQDAFSRRELTLVDAAEIGGLPAGEQYEIAEAICDGESPRQVAAEYLRGDKAPRDKLAPHLVTLVKSLERADASLSGRVEEIAVDPDAVDDQLIILERGAQLIADLLVCLQEKKRSQLEATMELCVAISELLPCEDDDWDVEDDDDDTA